MITKGIFSLAEKGEGRTQVYVIILLLLQKIMTVIEHHVFRIKIQPCSLVFLSTELAYSHPVFPYTPSSLESHLTSHLCIYLLINVLH